MLRWGGAPPPAGASGGRFALALVLACALASMGCRLQVRGMYERRGSQGPVFLRTQAVLLAGALGGTLDGAAECALRLPNDWGEVSALSLDSLGLPLLIGGQRVEWAPSPAVAAKVEGLRPSGPAFYWEGFTTQPLSPQPGLGHLVFEHVFAVRQVPGGSPSPGSLLAWAEASGGGFSQYISLPLDPLPGREDLQLANFRASVFDDGSFGSNDPLIETDDLGFEWPLDGIPWPPQQVLFEASLLVGDCPAGGLVRVVDNFLSSPGPGRDQDFRALVPVFPNPLATWDERTLAAYDDGQAEAPLGLAVVEQAHDVARGVGRDGLTDFAILRYTVWNQGGEPLDSLRVGMAFDWDIEDFLNNKVDFDGARDLGFIFNDVDYSPGYYAGVRVLRTADVPGTGSYTIFTSSVGGLTEEEKCAALSRGLDPPVSDHALSDKMFVIATPPLAIPVGGSVDVAFAVLAGAGLADLQANADSAQAAFDSPPASHLLWQVRSAPGQARGIPGVTFTWRAEFENRSAVPFEGMTRVVSGDIVIPNRLLEPDAGAIRLPARGVEAIDYALTVPRTLGVFGTFPLTTQLLDAQARVVAEATHEVMVLNPALAFDLLADDGQAVIQYVIQPIEGPQDWFAVAFPASAFEEIGFAGTERVEIAGVKLHGVDTGGTPGDPYPLVIAAGDNPDLSGDQPDTFRPLASRANVAPPATPGFVSAPFFPAPSVPTPQLLYAAVQLPPGQERASGDVSAISADDGSPAFARSLFSTDGIAYRAIPSRYGNLMLRLLVRAPDRAGEVGGTLARQGTRGWSALADVPAAPPEGTGGFEDALILARVIQAAPGQLIPRGGPFDSGVDPVGVEPRRAAPVALAPLLAAGGAVGGISEVPARMVLGLIRPNPLAASAPATIPFLVPGQRGAQVPVTLAIYTLRGARVRTLIAESLEPGAYEVVWDGRDGVRSVLPPGLYLLRLVVDGKGVSRKLVVGR